MRLFGFLVLVVAVIAAILFVVDSGVADEALSAPKFIVKVIGGVEEEGPKMITRVVEIHSSFLPPRLHALPYTDYVYSDFEDEDDEVYYFGETTYYDEKSDTFRMLVRYYYDDWYEPYYYDDYYDDYWYEDHFCYRHKSDDDCNNWWDDFCDDYEWHRKC